MSAAPLSLDDKYIRASGRIFLTGTQALVRLAMIQRDRDLAAGLDTAGFISGYRGSPLGGFDQALWKAREHLESHHVFFTPGVNEELAATAVWGSQQVGLFPGAKYDGVFAMWYGKGPGVDRCGDVFKHANAAGTAKHGGVLLVAGDDHACKSSTLPHQSEHAFDAAMIPVLYPTGVQEIIELGLHGFAMSRYSGCYVALKTISETVDSSASITVDPALPAIVLPDVPRFPRRHEHPLARHPARAGAAAAARQDLRRARLLPGQPAEPHHHRFAPPEARHHRLGQVLPRRAPGARRPRHRRAARGRDRHPPLQGRHALAPRAQRRARVRPGARRDPGGGGEAPAHRVPDEGAALQLARRRAAARHRKIRRARRVGSPPVRVAPAGGRGTHAGDDRPRHRRAHRQVLHLEDRRGAAQVPGGQGGGAGAAANEGRPHPVFLLRLPAQHVDPRAGRLEGARGDRVPLHGHLDPARADDDLHADGRRGRALDRHPAFHADEARLRESRRRNLLPLGPARHSRRRRGRREHDLQDPLQRRRRDDGRAAGRRGAHRPDGHAPGGCRGGQAHRDRHRRSREVRRHPGPGGGDHRQAPRRTRPRAARVARDPGRHRARVRPDLRGGEAPAPQARKVSRSRPARGDQRPRLRGMRRLRRKVQLPFDRSGGDRVRPQARHRPEHLQQGLFLPQGLLPQLRDGRGGQPSQEKARRARGRCVASRARASGARSPVGHPRDGRRRHRRRHHRRAAGHGGAPRGQGRGGARHDRARAEGRLGLFAHPHRCEAGGSPRGAHRRGRCERRHRLRHDRRGLRRGHRQDAGRPHARRHQRRRLADGRLHARSGPRDPPPGNDRCDPRGLRPGRDGFRRGRRARDRTDGRFDRHQPLHGRLRVADGPHPPGARGHRAARSS